MSDAEDRVTPVMPDPDDVTVRKVWERQEGEGEREWACFKAYRDMNPRLVHNAGFVGGVKIASAELSTWYRKWNWGARVEAYDILTDRIVQDQRKKVLEASADDWMADKLASLDMFDKVIELELGKYLEAAASGNGVGLVKPADLKGWMEASIKSRRLLKGETTENIGTGSADLSNMPMEELVQWHQRLKNDPKLKKPPAS